jgi:hypothetical protein
MYSERGNRPSLRATAPATTAPPPAQTVAAAGIVAPADPRFDGAGRLAPVVAQTTAGPQYALMDDKGAVLWFVTPAPGVNLRPYIDRQIGVNGQRGYLTDLKRQHISVQRVTLLEAGTPPIRR